MSTDTSQSANVAPPSIWSVLKDLLPLIASFTGIFVGLMIFMGIAYMRGFTAAVGIVPDQLKLDVSTFMLFGVQPFWFAVALLALVILYIGAAYALPDVLARLNPWQDGTRLMLFRVLFILALVLPGRFVKWFIRAGDAPAAPPPQPDEITRTMSAFRQSAVGVLVLVLVLWGVVSLGSHVAEQQGQARGRQLVIATAPQITFLAKEPLILSAAMTPTTTISNVLVYPKLSLITYNEQRYFVFRELDPVTCRPREVFAIAEGATLGVQVSPPSRPLSGTVALAPSCQ